MCCNREMAYLAVDVLEDGYPDLFFRYVDEMCHHCPTAEVTALLATAGAGDAFQCLAQKSLAEGDSEKANRYERFAQRYLEADLATESQRLDRLALPPTPRQELTAVP